MQETLLIRFHEIILMIYRFSIIGYFVDLFNKNLRIEIVVFFFW
ncbi:cytochrome C assembly protein, partial [Staphylococcus epidermidis]|nr:cytochrome C assembly protein [Staphylococcus epidermidis]